MDYTVQSAGHGCYTALKQPQRYAEEVRHGTHPGYQKEESNMGSQEVHVQSFCFEAVIQNEAAMIGNYDIRAWSIHTIKHKSFKTKIKKRTVQKRGKVSCNVGRVGSDVTHRSSLGAERPGVSHREILYS